MILRARRKIAHDPFQNGRLFQMMILFENLSRHQAETCGLVLSSAAIAYRFKRDLHGWSVWVDEQKYDAALSAMEKYFEENRDQVSPEEPKIEIEQASLTAGIISGLIGVLVILVVDAAVGGVDPLPETLRVFGASAVSITDGEWYRAITALFLHADLAHLAGNLAGIAIFGGGVCAVAGWGMGWLLVVGGGGVGNILNAYLYGSAHVSIGASTAVFAAVGFLAGYQFIRKRRTSKRRIAVWIPLAAGLALLGWLGSAAHTDIMAHLLGFVSGVGLGMVYFPTFDRPPAWSGQMMSAGFTAAAIAFCWWRGFAAMN